MRLLTDYIKKHGDEFCAKRWSVPVRTVAGWRRLESHPRPRLARAIIENSDGQVDMEGIYSNPIKERSSCSSI